MLYKITHLTSAHTRYDTRIFLKMCCSLSKVNNYKITLVVADGNGNEIINNVSIIDVGINSGSRIYRITNTVNRVYQKAKELDSDIYHLHDPELLPIGLKIKKLGKKIIFDAHEDLPKQLLSKPYLNRLNSFLLAKIMELYEKYTLKNYTFIITATPVIRNKFLKINKNCLDINNYPLLEELSCETPWGERKDEVCYVGGISKIRGIYEIINALVFTTNTKLNLVGTFNEKNLEQFTKSLLGWEKVNNLKYLGRNDVRIVMSQSKAGIVTFHPSPNHIDSQPNKIFEYMSAGLPVIASNFPLWKKIVEGNNCGICVDPLKPKAIADAIEYIITDSKKSQLMGKNGKKAVLEKYNWKVEETKLIKIYNDILND
uniref:glycosyltransferase n=1 Tax=Algoriphagus sp. TaxID=1872435 RepID=UPI0040472D65